MHHSYRKNGALTLRNFLSWIVDDWEYKTAFTVTINNLRLTDGSYTTLEYPVAIDLGEFE